MRRLPKNLVACVVVTLIAGPVMAQSRTDTETRNRALVQGRFDAWTAGTGNPFELLAEAAGWTIVGHSDAAGTYASREAFMREVIGPFNARMREGLKPAIRSLHADGDSVVILFDATGVARDGMSYANTYAWFFDMRDGRVIRATAFFDAITFNDLWRRLRP